MKCMTCEKSIPDDAEVCKYCGTPVGATGLEGRRRTALEGVPGAPNPRQQGFVPSGPSPQSPRAEPARGYTPSPAPAGVRRTSLDHDDPGNRTSLERDEGAAVRQARIVGWMISFDFNETGQEYVIREGKNLIGRSRDCDISIFYDDQVSDKHAVLVYRSGEFTLRDEMSTHGTWINGADIGAGQMTKLVDGAIVRFGRSTFKTYLLDLEEVRKLWPKLNAK